MRGAMASRRISRGTDDSDPVLLLKLRGFGTLSIGRLRDL